MVFNTNQTKQISYELANRSTEEVIIETGLLGLIAVTALLGKEKQ